MRYLLALLLSLTVLTTAQPATASGAPVRCRNRHALTYSTTVLGENAYFITADGEMAAADIRNCDILWRWLPHDADASIASIAPQLALQQDGSAVSFAVSDGAIFVLDDASAWERKSRLSKVDAVTGETVWSQPLEFLAESVFVEQGIVLAEGDEVLAGISAASGERIWRMPYQDEQFYGVTAHGLVFVPTLDDAPGPESRQTMQAIDVVSGEERWSKRFDAGFWFYAEPTKTDVLLFQGYQQVDDQINDLTIAVDVSTGAELWTTPGLQAVSIENFVEDGFGLLYPEAGKATLQSFDLGTGQPNWTNVSESTPYDMAFGDGVVVVADYQKSNRYEGDIMTVTAFSRATGAHLWSVEIKKGVMGLAVSGNYVYLVEGDYAWALDLATGEKLWTQYLDGNAYYGGAVTAAEDAIVVTNQSGAIYVFDPLP